MYLSPRVKHKVYFAWSTVHVVRLLRLDWGSFGGVLERLGRYLGGFSGALRSMSLVSCRCLSIPSILPIPSNHLVVKDPSRPLPPDPILLLFFYGACLSAFLPTFVPSSRCRLFLLARLIARSPPRLSPPSPLTTLSGASACCVAAALSRSASARPDDLYCISSRPVSSRLVPNRLDSTRLDSTRLLSDPALVYSASCTTPLLRIIRIRIRTLRTPHSLPAHSDP
ncbi:hypothetical protein B0J13DRAFT_75918 [Dactylonectria estremocensis]|uniref:Uncharacterized protein n=1 Tax=Dactylonectria estremocensis TaxID=1079267 RepID=A0A9P9EG55_9HYPO|nr:hypothetical protein B0J13DRAFT_75918 [Dactylonectria estremocensis]